MSRIGKLPIVIPEGVEIIFSEQTVTVKGPKGTLTQVIPSGIKVVVSEKVIRVSIENKGENSEALFGTTRSLLYNMVYGVSEGFKKELEIIGVGYKGLVEGDKLKVQVGFSHPVYYPIPAEIQIKVQEGKVEISGISKEKVGKVASEIRMIKTCNPYTGKGIKYSDEKVRRKAGKAAKTSSSFGAK